MKFVYCLLASLMMAFTVVHAQDNKQIKTAIDYKDQPVKVDGKYLITHTVMPKETLYSICKRYNVTVDALLTMNPTLTSGLKANSIIIVKILDELPVNGAVKESEPAGNVKTATDMQAGKKELNSKESGNKKQTGDKASKNVDDVFWEEFYSEPEKEAQPVKTNLVKMGIILPIHASDTLRFNRNYYDFYAGALLAAKEIKGENKNLVLNLYDQSDYSSLAAIENSGSFTDNNIIIGPVKRQSLAELLPGAAKKGIVIVSPMDQSSDSFVESFDNFIQVPPSDRMRSDYLSESLIEELSQNSLRKVLLIQERNGKDVAEVAEIIKILDSLNISYNSVTYGILEGRSILSKIISFLDKDAVQNVVIVPSNNEAFVSDVLRNLSLSMKQNYRITLFGQPKWRNFETINVELFHQMNLHLTLPYFINYDDEAVKSFILQFRALFNGEPSPFAFQSYDIVKYFSDAIYNGGTKKFIKHLPKAKMLQLDFDFVRKGEGMENIAMRKIIYHPDFSIEVR